MTVLLQKLLNDRDEVLLLYKNFSLCSCGHEFGDYAEAENHLVLKHQRREPSIDKNCHMTELHCSNGNIDDHSETQLARTKDNRSENLANLNEYVSNIKFQLLSFSLVKCTTLFQYFLGMPRRIGTGRNIHSYLNIYSVSRQ